MLIVPESKKRKVLMGTCMSVDKLRRDEHESGEQNDAAFERASKKLVMDGNSKDTVLVANFCWLSFRRLLCFSSSR